MRRHRTGRAEVVSALRSVRGIRRQLDRLFLSLPYLEIQESLTLQKQYVTSFVCGSHWQRHDVARSLWGGRWLGD